MKKYVNCQSCGMPLNKDEKYAGTEADGSLNEMYCLHCYENGEFTLPDITVIEMKEMVTNKIIEMKLPKFVAKFLTRNTCKLKRWKTVKPPRTATKNSKK
ncbi:zinc ribbon domain-containing protein [Clostridium bowmanii]|uniref:zinc ribbon domain-containing protein n=1 Tax=Clostridium bowmanii TaxID=132925 RepID=UPI001C0DA7E2|nr:zinc ribbon domain-containing protein [Clostridium bowmanii]MBU3190107.1 zinc ribbon domain-containing protein [Clostridium bowmanii]MCA1074702.1 zinc ribbon domain-containing protein [Clostridium bowmanii]